MRVDVSSATPRVPAADVRSRDPGLGHRSRDGSLTWQAAFDQASAMASGPGREPQPVFMATSAVGDVAVSFDARPIVAPVAEPAGKQREDSNSIPAVPIGGLEAIATTVVTSAAAAAAATSYPTSPLLTAGVTCIVNDKTSVSPGMVGKVSPAAIGTVTLTVPTTGRPIKTMAGSAARATAPAAAHSPVARVAVTAEAIHIVVPGNVLNDDDRSSLLRTVRETLAGTTLSGRPVRVFGRGSAR